MNLRSLIPLAQQCAYNDTVKKRFRRVSQAFLKELAEQLNLKAGQFEIRFNPGGIAVSGEATLHHEAFYLQIGEFGCYWRTCKGRKDYSGGANQSVVRADGREEISPRELKTAITRELVARGF